MRWEGHSLTPGAKPQGHQLAQNVLADSRAGTRPRKQWPVLKVVEMEQRQQTSRGGSWKTRLTGCSVSSEAEVPGMRAA